MPIILAKSPRTGSVTEIKMDTITFFSRKYRRQARRKGERKGNEKRRKAIIYRNKNQNFAY